MGLAHARLSSVAPAPGFSWNTAAVWKAMSPDETPPRPEIASRAGALAAVAAKPAELFSLDERAWNRRRSMRHCAAAASRRSAKILSALLPSEEIPAAAASLLGAWADSGIIVGIGSSQRSSTPTAGYRPRPPFPCAARGSAARRTTRTCRGIHASGCDHPRRRTAYAGALLASQSARSLRIISLPSV